MRKFINVFSIIVLTVCLMLVAGINLFQKNRPTVSESEKRELSAFPAFSLSSLLDGSYFAGIDAFVSDTFIRRETLVDISRKAKLLYGNTDDGIIVLSQRENQTTDDEDIYVPKVTEPATEETHPASTEETTQPIDTARIPPISGIHLNVDSCVINVGEEQRIDVTLDIEEDTPIDVLLNWTISNASVVTIRQNYNSLSLTGTASGTAILTISTPDGQQASCNITVLKALNPDGTTGIGSGVFSDEPEFLTGSMFIYDKAVYSIPYLVEKNAAVFGQTIEYYASLFPHARMSVLVAPLSSVLLDVPELQGKLTDQGEMINAIYSYMSDRINKVQTVELLKEHKNEYLFFKSDHHWTARGAYYAYAAFATSVGLTPTPLSDFEEVLLNDSYQGSMYSYTKDERVKLIYDSVYAYLPTKAQTMTIYYANGGSRTYDSSVAAANKNYLAFIAGDNPYTVINVPENPQDMNILVLKDSYGNAMIPFLTEHYGNIIVVDPRYINFNIYEHLKDYPLTDILSLTNIYNPNVSSWSVNLLRAVGVNQ